jgi:preprotein translocase subunit SecE
MTETVEKTKPQKKTSPMQFFSEVRSEMRKVTWATRGETVSSSIQVFIMVAIAALFFYLVDVILKFGVSGLLNFAAGIGGK